MRCQGTGDGYYAIRLQQILANLLCNARKYAPGGGSIRLSARVVDQVVEVGIQDSGIGIHFADLPARELQSGRSLVFTFFWKQAQHWEGQDFSVTVESS